ncbi:hypothetical protein CGZ93_00545 [Enemella dayhoffiae]|uniref:DUF2510 domain-containing protein n=1 Tax=Enemella dayhoffiae TaxID=2016507 RepID=A0A255HF90_9ACTN|nr:DUF2510 domain-containing protein [Enemella dayhoffiae]OYO24994.1 hypothetical protein CGZ93_00545 [Enemella dayhoffiae]
MPTNPTAPPRPGWYPDPRELADPEPDPAYRWWDGSGWTAWLADSAYAPAPRGEAPRVEPRVQSTPPRSARGLVAFLVVTTLLLGLTALSLFGKTLPERVPEAPTPTALGTPKRQVAPWSTRDRTAIVAERLEMTLAETYTPDATRKSLPGFLSHCWIASGGRQSANDTQYAQQILGALDPALVTPGEPAATAQRAYQELQKRYTAKVPMQWDQPRTEPWPGLPGAVKLTAGLRYQTTEPVAPETVTMLVLPWQGEGGSGMALWLSMMPTDEDPDIVAAAEASQRTIKLV